MSKKIIIVAGGTGGHVYPALALARDLHQQGQPVIFYTDPRGARYISLLDETFTIVIMPLQRRQDLWKFIRSLGCCFIQACKVVLKQRPWGVVSFGGYSALTWGLAAGLFRIPLILHEQNALRGRTNRLLALWAQRIALTFETGKIRSLKSSSKECVTGLPLRKEFKAQPYHLPSSPQPFRLLVVGGSQGAKVFNDIVPQAITLLPKTLRRHLQIDQQCSAEEIQAVQEIYNHHLVQAFLAPFFVNMAERIEAAHLIIARAGASTLAEITTVGRPVIIVPYLYAQDDHQTLNAKVYTQVERGWFFDQKALTPQRLASFLERVLENPQLLILAAETSQRYGHTQATKALSTLVLKNFLHYNENNLSTTS